MHRSLLLALGALAAAWTAGTIAASPAPSLQLRVVRLVDRSRQAHFRSGKSGPRVLVTYVRYPSQGQGPFPLVVFGHGFATTPKLYTPLLDTWARAGYVVAAPVFPVENEHAPGGPDESDLVNQPRDLSFVISSLTASTSPLRGLIDAKKIAVAGQSDGAETALATAYDGRYLDRRVDAAVVLSGAAFPGFARPRPGSPPLLAVQGTDDPINRPSETSNYYRLMRRPKFLLWLIGATHLPPYTTGDRWAPVVDQVTTAFLDHYLKGKPLGPVIAEGTRPGVARIAASP